MADLVNYKGESIEKDLHVIAGETEDDNHGLMCPADKKKLDSIAEGANNYVHPTYTTKPSGLYKITVDGTGHVSATDSVTKDDIIGLGIVGSATDTWRPIQVNGTAIGTSETLNIKAGTNVTLTEADGAVTITAKDNTYTSLKNPYSLTIQGNGTTLTNGIYDGSAAKTINITPSSIGASASGHTHNYLPLTGGTLTGTTTIQSYLTIKKDDYTGNIVGRNAAGKLRYEAYVNSTGGAVGEYKIRVATNDEGTEYKHYTFGTDGVLTAEKFKGALTGNADTATKLGTATKGSATQPIYLNAGTPTACTYTLGKSVPSDAKFTDTVYTHPTSGITAGTYKSVTVNAQGHVTSGSNPTTLAGYGITDAAKSEHTHNYAGSASAGGSANSAVKLDTTTAGSATQPVYFSGGKPVATTYTLAKSVPSNALFTDTDTKVTQTAVTASSYTNWRPLMIGSSNNATEDFSPTTLTDTSFTVNTLSCQPSTGTIKANVFKTGKGKMAYDESLNAIKFTFD